MVSHGGVISYQGAFFTKNSMKEGGHIGHASLSYNREFGNAGTTVLQFVSTLNQFPKSKSGQIKFDLWNNCASILFP